MHRTNKHGSESEHVSPNNAVVASTEQPVDSHDPYQALRFRDFRLFLAGDFIATLGTQMVLVAIGWELYDRTSSALALGGVGLAQVLPVILLSLPAGHVADRFNRKVIAIVTQVLLALGSLSLTWLSYTHSSLLLIYSCLVLIGAAVAFNTPAATVLVTQIVPERSFANAATWSSSSWQLASVIGPALGGFGIALFHSATPIYALNAGAMLIFALMLVLMRIRQQPAHQNGEQTTLGSLAEGLRFLGKSRIILAAITLDLFAVLFGGATTLLPIYAKDILHVGPTGLGWLRAAPSIGAVCVAFSLAHLPPFKRAGRTLLLVVAGFGVATVVFGISQSFWLSLLMLFALGGFDNISVVIRHTLLLTRTPEEMRGRISSVNSLFVAASNELGGFESGLAAQIFSPVLAVAGGGIGTVLVVLCVALLWPEMRHLTSLSGADR